MLRALGCGPAPPPPRPPEPQQRRGSDSEPQPRGSDLQRYRSLLKKRGELLRTNSRRGLPELLDELERLRDSLGYTQLPARDVRAGDRVRLLRDAEQLASLSVSGAKEAARWAGHVAAVESVCGDDTLRVRLPDNRTCLLSTQAVTAADSRRASATSEGLFGSRRNSFASEPPSRRPSQGSFARPAPEQDASPLRTSSPASAAPGAPTSPASVPHRRKANTQGSQGTRRSHSPRAQPQPNSQRERGWGRPATAGARRQLRAAEALRYGVSRARREDPYCLQGSAVRVASAGAFRRSQPTAAPAHRQELCRFELLIRPDVALSTAARVLRGSVWVARGIIPSSIAFGTRADPQAHAVRCAATVSASSLAAYVCELCEGSTAVALSCAFSAPGTAAPCPCPAPPPAPPPAAADRQSGDAPFDVATPRSEEVHGCRSTSAGTAQDEQQPDGASTPPPQPQPPPPPHDPQSGSQPQQPLPQHLQSPVHSEQQQQHQQQRRRSSRRGSRRGSRASVTSGGASTVAMDRLPLRMREELKVRRKIAETVQRANKLRSELVRAQAIRAEQQSRLAEEEARHGTACKISSELLEFNGVVCAELGKLWQALEQVVRTLGQCSAQWSKQLTDSGDPGSAWMGRGVLSELMATTSELLERMRELKRLRRLAARDPSRRPGDGLTGRSTLLSGDADLWDAAEP
eukprot:TRINITY_DN1061_c3_g1_i1.p1 TRINITY_DN1061_c3_g1~~TRINITY_DN1061_c3_g1_i1.p1  ORF type:complete len:760 (+),score=264.35 TRINITY_DN1061_c3_g1_i1:211-2280(+)